jgi:rhodanese-related sulfurtransferase
VARQLVKMGFSGVYALKGGWREWLEAGFPLDPK